MVIMQLGGSMKKLLFAAMVLTIGLLTIVPVFGGGSRDTSQYNTLRVWHYEGETSAMGIAWDLAFQRLMEKHPNVFVDFESKGFEQIRQTAPMILNSNNPPDVMEYNKGNATAGLLSSQGLLQDLTAEVQRRGWDKIISPSLAITSRYSPEGIMGSGKWFGITNYGEFVMAYYNMDMFRQYGLRVPTTLAEFETVMQAFVDRGITPLAMGGSEYPAQQLFYALALSKADQAFIDAYQLYQGRVNFSGPEFRFAAEKMLDWINRGFISTNSISLGAEEMGLDFINGRSPIMFSGSWWFGRLMNEINSFEWGTFLFPGNTFHLGSGGNLWVVPARARNKELAYDFIDITLSPEIQMALALNGGIPVAADPSAIDDPRIRGLIKNFNDILDMNGLAFYPDWPVPGFYDVLVSNVQRLMGRTHTIDQVLSELQRQYDNR
jgi:raffinose/stachyose/melibiose transport system substrate-binding protein